MSPQRGDRAAPPRVDGEYEIRFDNSESAKGWDELARVALVNRGDGTYYGANGRESNLADQRRYWEAQ